jgi:CHRD domain
MADRLQCTRPMRVACNTTVALATLAVVSVVGSGATAASAERSAVPTKLSAVLTPSSDQEFRKRTAHGTFRATYSPSAHSLKFKLTYSGLSGRVRVAELHVGKITHAGFTGRYPVCDGHHVVCVSGKWITIDQVFPDLFVELGRRGGYIDLHTLKNTAGEAAGKLHVGK